MIIAARNEAERIGATLVALRETFPGVELIVADDGSTDATSRVAADAGARVIRLEESQGKGGAMTRATSAADARIVLLADADLGESAAELRALVDAVEAGADLAIATFARRVGGGFGIAVGAAGRAIERATGRRMQAPISGQRAMRAEVLQAVLPFAAGFGMETGMTIDAIRAGFKVVEVELDLEHRATGRTLRGFAHRARQLRDIVRAYASRRS